MLDNIVETHENRHGDLENFENAYFFQFNFENLENTSNLVPKKFI